MRLPRLRLGAKAACLLALLVQALQPAGFMPAEGGRAFLKLCSGSGLQLSKTGDHPGDHHFASCAFAAVGTGCAPPCMLFAAPVAMTVSFQPFAASLARSAHSGPLRAQSPRGPPVSLS